MQKGAVRIRALHTMKCVGSRRVFKASSRRFSERVRGLRTAELEKLVRLRKALRIAEEERDILKKATAFFAKQSR